MRKTKTITIPGVRSDAQGERDNGKTFLITEMASRQAEQWADRAFLALAHSSVNLPPGIEHTGMAGIAQIATLMGGIQFPELLPLMDELMACVQVIPDIKRPAFTRLMEDNGREGDDIEEVSTRQLLRSEVLDLHVNFSLAAVILNLMAAASELKTLPISETT